MKTLSAFCGKLVYSKYVQNFVLACIIINAVQLGLDTSPAWTAAVGSISRIVDAAFIVIFTIEIVLKLIADGPRFFKSGWNVFDFLVVAIALVPGNGAFSALRSLRVLRVARLFSRIPRLKVITESLFKSVPSIGWISLLLAIFFYICSVIATNLFGAAFPDWFGSIGKSMYSLFQIMTLESWSMGIVRPVMEQFPYAWLMFVPFIVIATYTVLNLFIGVMCTAVAESQPKQEVPEDEFGKENMALNRQILEEIRRLREEVDSLKSEIGKTDRSV